MCALKSQALQVMRGGDLRHALAHDITECGLGASRRMGWYVQGHRILLDVASGLTYLHGEQVCVGGCGGVFFTKS